MHVQSSGHAVARRSGTDCEDAWIVRERGNTIVAALADGIGSSKEGGVAARRAVEMLADYCLTRPRAWSPRRALAEFASRINRQLHSESIERHGQPELACTLSAVMLEAGRLYGCNVGDSPVLHWRRGRLQPLSEAHALAASGLDHVLTRAIGLDEAIEPHFFELELENGDLVLLCSDGVTTPLPAERLAEHLSRRVSARTIVSAARAITEDHIELADDVSAVVLEVVDRGGVDDVARQGLEIREHLRAGDAIAGLTLERPMDPGRRVWLGVSPQGARVVLKFPPVEAIETEALRDAFVREAWNATRLASPDLVRSWIPDEIGSFCCYAMEFVDAPTLRAVLKQRRLAMEDARELGIFLLRVGEFLLRHDLAHGDIKPENILVLPGASGAKFRLLDLGSAAELFSVTSRAGTPSYLAPERFRGAALSERTEVFAIGVTLYESLTGVYPYGEIERFQTPRFDTPPRRPARLNAHVPAWMESVLLRAVEADPERRYQNLSEMMYSLQHPAHVAPHHRKDTPLLERNPLLFYKLLCVLLLAICLWLTALLTRR